MRFVMQNAKGKLARHVMKGRPGKGFPADLFQAAVRKMMMLDAANEPGDLRVPPANRLETLKNSRRGQNSMRINSQWRVCSIWTEQGPVEVAIADCH